MRPKFRKWLHLPWRRRDLFLPPPIHNVTNAHRSWVVWLLGERILTSAKEPLTPERHKLPNKWLIFRSRVLWQEQEWCQKEFDRNTHMSIYSTNQENEGQLDMLNEADETPEIASRPFPTYGHRVSDIWKVSLRKRDDYGWSLVCYRENWWASSCRRSKEASASRGKTFHKR